MLEAPSLSGALTSRFTVARATYLGRGEGRCLLEAPSLMGALTSRFILQLFWGVRLREDGSVPLLGAPSLLGALTSRFTVARATQFFGGQIFTS